MDLDGCSPEIVVGWRALYICTLPVALVSWFLKEAANCARVCAVLYFRHPTGRGAMPLLAAAC